MGGWVGGCTLTTVVAIARASLLGALVLFLPISHKALCSDGLFTGRGSVLSPAEESEFISRWGRGWKGWVFTSTVHFLRRGGVLGAGKPTVRAIDPWLLYC